VPGFIERKSKFTYITTVDALLNKAYIPADDTGELIRIIDTFRKKASASLLYKIELIIGSLTKNYPDSND